MFGTAGARDLGAECAPDLDAIAARINALVAHRSLDSALALGELLLEEFFDGSIEVYTSGGGALSSYRDLAGSPGLHVSHTHLNYALRVTVQVRSMPEELWRPLSFAHHKLLLQVEDASLRDWWAGRAVQSDWSARHLARELKKVRAPRERRRRRGQPDQLAQFRGELDALVARVRGFDAFSLDFLSGEDAGEALRTIDRAVRDLGEAYAHLRRVRAAAAKRLT